jgi:hypothetical protein
MLYVIFTPLHILNAEPEGSASLNVLWQPVTLSLINPPLLYSIASQNLGIAEIAIYKSAVYTFEELNPHSADLFFQSATHLQISTAPMGAV